MFHTRSFVPAFLAFCGFVCASACPAKADIVTAEATADSFIMSNPEYAKGNFGTDPFLMGHNNGSERNALLLQFNIAKTKSSIIRSARLRLWSAGWVGNFENVAPTYVYAVATPWAEREVSWLYATNERGWKNEGGDILGIGAQTAPFAVNSQGMSLDYNGIGMMEWDITELVRLWASRKLSNNGLRIDVSDGFFLFESRECEQKDWRPTIIIDVEN